MKNTTKILATLSLSAALVAPAAEAQAKSAKRPNVLFIFADDMRYDAIHALGGTVVKTPNLDKIVRSGVSFDNAYLQGSNTGATSMASRAQLLTGRGVFDIPDGKGATWGEEYTNFPEVFQSNGYYTFFTGKSHNGEKASSRGFSDGAKLYGLSKGYYKPHFRMPYQDYRADQSYNKKHLYFVGGENHEKTIKPSETSEYVGPHSTDIFAKAAIDFLEAYDKEQPFMMYVAFHAPHDTRNYPAEYNNMYKPAEIPLPDNFRTSHPFDNGDLLSRDERLAPFPRSEENTRSQLAEYYRCVTHMDDRIGDILETLKEKGLDKNTIIVFSTDSGLGMGSHGLFGKQNLYDDAGIRVPMVFSGAGLPKGKRKADLCYNADIYPTLCELVGIDIPNSVTGLSQAKSVKGKSLNRRKYAYFGYCDTQRAIRDERFKLIEYCVDGERHTQLFDLSIDRMECNDISTLPEFQLTLKRLREALIQHSTEENGNKWGIDFWRTYMANY